MQRLTKLEKEQRKEEFFNNDIPAIAPVFGGFKDSEPVVEKAVKQVL